MLLENHPRVRLKRALFSFVIVVIIISVFYMSTPISRLGVVNFEGLNMLNRSELISLMGINDDELFLGLRLAEIQGIIEKHPIVNQANVTRVWINQIHIEVIEYEVVACAFVENETYHILTDGTLLPASAGMRANCDEMMIYGLTSEVDENIPSRFVRQLMRVDPEIRGLIQMIEHAPLYNDIYRFSLSMTDGNTVNVTAHTMPEQLNLYLSILEKMLVLGRVELGQTGILNLDVGNYFAPHD